MLKRLRRFLTAGTVAEGLGMSVSTTPATGYDARRVAPGHKLVYSKALRFDPDRGRSTLYVLDKHHRNIATIVGRVTDRPDGVIRAFGVLQAEPHNTYDPEAVQVLVDGKPVGYLALDAKISAHRIMKREAPHRVVLDLVIHGGNQPRVYYFDTKSGAEAWAAHLAGD